MPRTIRRLAFPKHLILSPPPPQHIRFISTTSPKSSILPPSQNRGIPQTLAHMKAVNTTNIKTRQHSTIPTPERQHIIQDLDGISKHLSSIEKSQGRVTAYFRRESQHNSRSPEVRNRNANFSALFETSFAIHSEIAAVQSSVSSLKTHQEFLEVSRRVSEGLAKLQENQPSEKELATTAEQWRYQQQPENGKDFWDALDIVIRWIVVALLLDRFCNLEDKTPEDDSSKSSTTPTGTEKTTVMER